MGFNLQLLDDELYCCSDQESTNGKWTCVGKLTGHNLVATGTMWFIMLDTDRYLHNRWYNNSLKMNTIFSRFNRWNGISLLMEHYEAINNNRFNIGWGNASQHESKSIARFTTFFEYRNSKTEHYIKH